MIATLLLNFGYFFAVTLIAMVIGVRGYRVLEDRRALRDDSGQAAAAPSPRYN